MVTYREFLDWITYFKIEFERTEKIELYLARLTGIMSGKSEFKISDYLIDFANKKNNKESIKLNGKEIAEMFKGYFGIKGK